MLKSKDAVRQSARNELTNRVLRVGYGRGFVVECRPIERLGTVDRLVITAAHCLTTPIDDRYASTPEEPCLPAAHPARSAVECTYVNLLGPLGGETTVAAECLFVDPVSDIAVLGAPDVPELVEAYNAYHKLVEAMAPLRIAAGKTYSMKEQARGIGIVQVLALDGRWIRLKTECRFWWLAVPEGSFEGGMSGSPILDLAGNAIGLVSTDSSNAFLTERLPAGLVRRIRSVRRASRK